MTSRTSNRRSAASASGKGPAQAAGLRRTTRSGLKASKTGATEIGSSSSELSENDDGEDASDEDLENEDADEPDDYAPSRSTRNRARGHQTGLSLTLSKTDIGQAGRRKRRMSNSSEGTVTTRLIKRTKPSDFVEEACDTSEDEGYDAVNEISESEEDASDIEQFDYQDIEFDAEHGRIQWEQDGNMQNSAFDEQWSRTEHRNQRDRWTTSTFDGIDSAPTDEVPVRRVRFAGIDSSSNGDNSSSENENLFPDLLLHEPEFIGSFMNGFADENDGQSSDGYWDLEEEDEEGIVAENGYAEPVSSSSGYETDSDDGTTTEEDIDPPQTVSAPKKMLEIRSDSPKPDGYRPRRIGMPRTRPAANLSNKKGPILGKWIADPSLPIAIIDKTGGLKYYHVPSKTYGTLESSTSSVDSSPQRTFVPFARPASSGEATHVDANQLGIPTQSLDQLSSEAFLPMDLELENVFQQFESDSSSGDTDKLNIEDLIHMDDDSSDDENKSESEAIQTPAKPMPMPKLPKITPKQSADRTSSQNLLEHFDRGIVSAFRRNQHRAQTQINRMPMSGLLAIKGGRHTMANNPISPMRKRKASRSLSQSSGPINGVNTKRRLSTPATRQRQNTL